MSRDGHVKLEAEVDGGLPPPEARRGGKAPPHRFQRERGPADTLTLDV